MPLFKRVVDRKEQEKKKKLCETLFKDIRHGTGVIFENEQKTKKIELSSIHASSKGFLFALTFSEVIEKNKVEQWWSSITSQSMSVGIDQLEPVIYDYYADLHKCVKDVFSCSDTISCHIEHDQGHKTSLYYLIEVIQDERILPFSKKVKKALLKVKNYYFNRNQSS